MNKYRVILTYKGSKNSPSFSVTNTVIALDGAHAIAKALALLEIVHPEIPLEMYEVNEVKPVS